MGGNSDRIKKTAKTGRGQAGHRLDQVAAELFGDYSRARLQKWIRSGELTVDGHSSKPTYRVTGGETLQLNALPEIEEKVFPQDIPIKIIHADDDVILIDKSAGMVVHPAVGNPDGTLQNALLHFDSSLAMLPRSGIVHRLDKDTTGIMIVARSFRAHNSLVEQLQSRTMSRVYEAVAKGEIKGSGTVDAPVGRHPRNRKMMAVVPSGRHAVTHYRLIQPCKGSSHLEVRLETGRTHQIRVHMAYLGYPLLGDAVYGKKPKPGKAKSSDIPEEALMFPRQALHARTLSLVHPATQERVTYESPLSPDIAELLQTLSCGAVG
jgi:23S rRNA pseudouridine1911/1915/1917 synthase